MPFWSWIIGDRACGLGIREDRSQITANLSRYVPHIIRDDGVTDCVQTSPRKGSTDIDIPTTEQIGKLMATGLLALLDDVTAIAKLAATSQDDVAAQTAKAGTKAAAW